MYDLSRNQLKLFCMDEIINGLFHMLFCIDTQ